MGKDNLFQLELSVLSEKKNPKSTLPKKEKVIRGSHKTLEVQSKAALSMAAGHWFGLARYVCLV